MLFVFYFLSGCFGFGVITILLRGSEIFKVLISFITLVAEGNGGNEHISRIFLYACLDGRNLKFKLIAKERVCIGNVYVNILSAC